MQNFKIKIIFFISLAMFLFVFLPKISQAATLQVGSGRTYSTIQSALNAASNGGRIEVFSNGSNVYTEDITFNSLQNVELVGMLTYCGITIKAANTGNHPILIGSGTFGITIENFKLTNDYNGSNYYIYVSGSNATFRNCEFNGQRTDAAGNGPIVISGDNASFLESYFNVGRAYAALQSMDSADNLLVKYCEFYGGVNYTLGPGEGGSGHNFSYNYFRTTGQEAPSWKAIRMRGIKNYTLSHNLIVISGISGWQAGINDRFYAADTGPATIEHNTIIMSTTASSGGYFQGGFNYEGTVGANGVINVKNNLVYGGAYSHSTLWGGNNNLNVSVTYNYHYKPSTAFYRENSTEGFIAVKSNNIETTTNIPGFVGSGTVWQTDGTDFGTISQYYSLNSGAAAASACEGGTYCGAFGALAQPGTTPPAAPTGVAII